jgi:molybdopterin-guanine dinucleotide biosynthesis protein A
VTKARQERTSITNLGGIVLAGGAGRRLGRPKAGVVVGGRTLVERAVDLLRPHCGSLVVIGRPEVALPPLHVPVHHDRPGPDAALNALATGLAVLGTDDALVLACDLPAAGPVVDRLAAVAPGTAAAARERGGGRWQPLCARYPRRAALEACDALLAEGELRLLRLLDALAPVAVDASPGDLANINSPSDLARAIGVSRPRPDAC